MQKNDIDETVIDLEKAKKGLASLIAKKKHRSTTSIIKEMRVDILKARRAGRTWAEISETLAESGINASVHLLSLVLSSKKTTPAAPAPAPAAPAGNKVGDKIKTERAASPAPAPAPALTPAPAQMDTTQVKKDGKGGFTISPVMIDI